MPAGAGAVADADDDDDDDEVEVEEERGEVLLDSPFKDSLDCMHAKTQARSE